MKARLRMFILGSVGLCATVSAGAQGRAEGAIVIRDGAPVYIKSEGSAIQDTRVRGDFVAGATTLGITIQSYQFEEENGRVHVDYFRDKDQKGMARLGWMDPADLSRFTYECGCGSRHKPCSPFSEQGFLMRWNTCYLEAKDRKASELGKPAAESAGPPAKPEDNKPKSNEKPLTNADVLAMSKAGLGDELIVSKIQQAPSNFDTSPDALIRLKKAGVSKAILDAMVKGGTAPPAEKKTEARPLAAPPARSPGVVVNGKNLVLNGSGLRRKLGVVLYSGDLYLESKTAEASVVMTSEQTKRLVLRVMYQEIKKDQLASSIKKGFKDNAPGGTATLREAEDRFLSWMPTVHAGDEIIMTYVPGGGTTVSVGGEAKGTIEGKDFGDALFSVWLGKDPVDDDLKKALLGESS